MAMAMAIWKQIKAVRYQDADPSGGKPMEVLRYLLRFGWDMKLAASDWIFDIEKKLQGSNPFDGKSANDMHKKRDREEIGRTDADGYIIQARNKVSSRGVFAHRSLEHRCSLTMPSMVLWKWKWKWNWK